MIVPRRVLRALVAVVLFACLGVSQLHAAITSTGDTVVDPNQTLVGINSFGTLEVTAPDTLTTQQLRVGDTTSGFGEVLIDAGTIEAGETRIGNVGPGVMRIVNGGQFLTNDPGFGHSIGAATTGRVEVSGAGSLADFTADSRQAQLFVGGVDSFSPNGAYRGEVLITEGAEWRTDYSTLGVAGSASVLVDGPGSRWVIRQQAALGAADVTLSGGAQVVALEGGFFSEDTLVLGENQASSTLILRDEGTSMSGIGSLVVGSSGQGVIRVEGGADVATGTVVLGGTEFFSGSPDPQGIVQIDGLGTTWTTGRILFGGEGGRGELHLTGGASLTQYNESSIWLAEQRGSEVEVTIDGSTTRWSTSSSDLAVGYRGHATLRITGGASHVSGSVNIGSNSEDNATGYVEVSGEGSTWQVGPFFSINRGELEVTGGARVIAINSFDIDSDSVLRLDGGTIDMTVGDGNGISNFGLIEGDGVIKAVVRNELRGFPDVEQIRVGPGQRLELGGLYNNALVIIEGGELTLPPWQQAENYGEIRINDGNLRITGPPFGNRLFSNGLLRFVGGTSTVEGMVDSTNSAPGIVVENSSSVSFSDSVDAFAGANVEAGATLVFESEYRGGAIVGDGDVVFEGSVVLEEAQTGGYSQFESDVTFEDSARWSIDYEDTDTGENGTLLSTTGDVQLGGELAIISINNVEVGPNGLGELPIVLANSVSGVFDEVPADGTLIGARTVFRDVIYNPTMTSLLVETYDPADLNADGFISLADYDAWVAAFGTGDPWADGNGDGMVDLADYTLWRDAYVTRDRTQVPEPLSLGLLTLSIVSARRRISR